MSLQGYVHQLRPRKESYANHVERLQILTEQTSLPKDVFGGLSYEKNERQSSSKRDVIIVRSKDRETDRDEILRNLISHNAILVQVRYNIQYLHLYF